MQERNQRGLERFHLREVTFSERIDDNSFNNLFAVKEYVHKTYTMAMQYNVGQSNINAWRENVVFIQHLIDNLSGRSHGWAMQALQSQFGGTKGLSKGKKKVADRIIRESVRHAPATGFLQGGHGTMPPVYHTPQNFFPYSNGDGCACSWFWRTVLCLWTNGSHEQELPELCKNGRSKTSESGPKEVQ